MSDATRAKMRATAIFKIPSHSIPIVCNQTGKVYKSIAQAAHVMGLNKTQLSKHVQGRPYHNTVRGYTFSMIGSNENAVKEKHRHSIINKIILKESFNKISLKARSIICDQTGQGFPSVNQAARIMGLHPSNLYAHVNGRRVLSVSGYTFSKVKPADAPQSVKKVESSAPRAYWMSAPSSSSFA